MSSAYLSPFLSTNISQPEFRPRLGYPHEPMPLRMLPTLTQKIVHGVIQMSRPKYGLAQSKLADTLIFFTPLSLDLELPEACAIPPISDLLIKGDTVELLIIPQPEEEGIRWFAERVRKIPFSSSSLPLVAAKRNETLNDLESLEPPFFNGTYGARKQRLDDVSTSNK